MVYCDYNHPPDEGDALERFAESHLVGQHGAASQLGLEAHDAMVEEEHAVALVRSQVSREMRVHHHVHHRPTAAAAAAAVMLPLIRRDGGAVRGGGELEDREC